MIYLDYNATTPVSNGVFEAMRPWLQEKFFNASSSHFGGRLAADAVEESRQLVLSSLGASQCSLVFTSGATESNNLALSGIVGGNGRDHAKIVTFATEHKAVLDVVSHLQGTGVDVAILPVGPDGMPDLSSLERELRRSETTFVSAMAVNNETGAVADIKTISGLAHAYGALFHTDATQAIGRIDLRVDDAQIDLLSFSGHKIYGPKGIGGLVVRRGVELSPQILGGGHQRGVRSGTLNVPSIVGLGIACRDSIADLDREGPRQRQLIELLLASLGKRLDGFHSIGPDANNRACNVVNICFDGVDAEAVMANMPSVAVSAGSACSALIPQPSHVLLAMGLSNEEAESSLRFSVGRPTTEAEVSSAVDQIIEAVHRVRELMS